MIFTMSRRAMLELVLPIGIAASLAVLWAVSHYVCARVTRSDGRREPCILLACGNLIFRSGGGRQAEPPFPGRSLQRGEWALQVARVPDPPEQWMRVPNAGVPLWFLAIPTVIGPVVWLDRRYTARKALRQGRCPVCKYDLRATPDGQGMLLERCPECGSATPPAPAASA